MSNVSVHEVPRALPVRARTALRSLEAITMSTWSLNEGAKAVMGSSLVASAVEVN